MQFKQLQYLLGLKEYKSITKTAEAFYISHQAISKSIKTLENELSCELLDRSVKGVKLTPAGERVAKFAENVIKEKKTLEKELLRYRSDTERPSKPGKLRIYCIPRYVTSLFWQQIKTYQRINPAIDISIITCSTEKILNEIDFDENSIAFITVDETSLETLVEILNKRQLKYALLFKKELYTCVYNNSSLANKQYVTFDELVEYPQLAFNYPCKFVDTHFKKTIQEKYIVDNFEEQKRFLKQFDCAAMYTYEEYTEFFSDKFRLIPTIDPTIRLCFVCVFCVKLSEPVEAFIRYYHKHSMYK